MFLSKRNGVYYLVYRDGAGKRVHRSTGVRSKSEAVEFLRKFNEEADARRRSLKKISLEEFLPVFVSYSQSIHTRHTVRAHQTAVRELMHFIGASCVMNSIMPADCERFLATKTSEASAWTARKYYLALAAVFERAKTWGHITENPWRKVKKTRTPEVLPAYFTREQIQTLLAVIDDRDFRELVIVAVLTGLRLGELLAMQWDWVDFTQRTITVKNTEGFTTKSKRVRVVPICEDAMTVFLSRRERCDVRHKTVFTRKGKPILPYFVSHRFKKYILKVGLPRELHWHSLRHYADIRTMPSSHVDFSSLVGSPIAYSA